MTTRVTTRAPAAESARQTACNALRVRPDVLEHRDEERGLLLALAARLVLQTLDNDLTRLESALAQIGGILRPDYPYLAR